MLWLSGLRGTDCHSQGFGFCVVGERVGESDLRFEVGGGCVGGGPDGSFIVPFTVRFGDFGDVGDPRGDNHADDELWDMGD